MPDPLATPAAQCPGCGQDVTALERPVYRYRADVWCTTDCMEVAGGLRMPYRLGRPDEFGVRPVEQLPSGPPPACCGGGPQWGHSWDCRQCPD